MGGLATLYYKSKIDRCHFGFFLINDNNFVTRRRNLVVLTRSSDTAKSTAHPSCLTGVLYDIYREKICWWLINHFYIIGHDSYRIRRNNANNGHYAVQGHSRSPILVPIEGHMDFLLVINTNILPILYRFRYYWLYVSQNVSVYLQQLLRNKPQKLSNSAL